MKLNNYTLDLSLARAGMNRRELSQKCGIHETMLCKIYRGKSKPSTKTIGKIARALDVDVEYLIEQEAR